MLRLIVVLAALFAASLPCPILAGPVVGADGVLRFPYGERNPPTLHCAPLFVCDVVLEPGETIVNVAVGDSIRWLIAPASSGPNANVTSHVLIKPTEADLHTNLVVTTNKRTYYLTLASRKQDPMLRIGFTYPQDVQQVFGMARSPRDRGAQPTAQLPEVNIDKLDFAYHMTGERSIQPTHVFNDGAHTYLQMPAAMNNLPVLFAQAPDGGDEMVNYRLVGQYYMVDGVPDRLTLVDGSGKKQRRASVIRGN